jgi:hypothetical protein
LKEVVLSAHPLVSLGKAKFPIAKTPKDPNDP